MAVILTFLGVIAAISGWWLLRNQLMEKPWLVQGEIAGASAGEHPDLPTEKIALGVFLAVVGCLFALFTSAYFMRMALTDWQPMPVPRLIWVNTGLLILSSVALQCAVIAARAGQADTLRLALVTGGLTTLAFLIGQVMAWRELTATGYLLTSNPANSFFYLITAAHGLHIIGGLVALARTTAKAWTGAGPVRLRLSVELCATYWHFLLFIWLALIVVLTGWANDFIDICRQLLS